MLKELAVASLIILVTKQASVAQPAEAFGTLRGIVDTAMSAPPSASKMKTWPCDSVYLHICKTARVPQHLQHLNVDAVEHRLCKIISQREITCLIKLKSNGQIQSLAIERSSGIGSDDKKALRLIRDSGPFDSVDDRENFPMIIELPSLKVRPNDVKNVP